MSRKRVIIGQSEWGIEDQNVTAVVAAIKTALTDGTLAELPLLDGSGRVVTVYLNGRTVLSVVVDLDVGPPKPTEIPGA